MKLWMMASMSSSGGRAEVAPSFGSVSAATRRSGCCAEACAVPPGAEDGFVRYTAGLACVSPSVGIETPGGQVHVHALGQVSKDLGRLPDGPVRLLVRLENREAYLQRSQSVRARLPLCRYADVDGRADICSVGDQVRGARDREGLFVRQQEPHDLGGR